MARLVADNYIEPSRVEATKYAPRFWVDGKPECGVFTLDELRAAYPDEDELRRFMQSHHNIIFDVTRRCVHCGK